MALINFLLLNIYILRKGHNYLTSKKKKLLISILKNQMDCFTV